MTNTNEKKQFQMLSQLASKYSNNERHALVVEKAALKIFDCLKPIHKLSASERILLSHSALLHDIGCFVNSKQHSKHSKYIIDNDETFSDYPENEKKLLSLIVYNHRKKVHKDMSLLIKREKDIVMKLSAILRIADSLDYVHEEAEISEISIKNSELRITIDSVLPERISGRLQQKKDLFVSIFGLDIVLNS